MSRKKSALEKINAGAQSSAEAPPSTNTATTQVRIDELTVAPRQPSPDDSAGSPLVAAPRAPLARSGAIRLASRACSIGPAEASTWPSRRRPAKRSAQPNCGVRSDRFSDRRAQLPRTRSELHSEAERMRPRD